MDFERYIFIGDVHGCLTEVKQLVDMIKYDRNKDRLVFLGDLVDRGPHSAECVQFVRELNVECVIGNHDNKLLRYHKHEQRHKKNKRYRNPIKYSIDQREAYRRLRAEDFAWLYELPRYIHIKEINTILLHAGVMSGQHPLRQAPHAYIYCRYIDKDTGKMLHLRPDFSIPDNGVFWAQKYEHKYNIVYGHQVVDLNTPHIRTNNNNVKTFGIDCGAVYGGNLTALIMYPDQTYEVAQVKSSFKYKDFVLAEKT